MIEILLALILAFFFLGKKAEDALVDGECTGGNHCLEVEFNDCGTTVEDCVWKTTEELALELESEELALKLESAQSNTPDSQYNCSKHTDYIGGDPGHMTLKQNECEEANGGNVCKWRQQSDGKSECSNK